MNHSRSTQATAFGLAALVTLTLMAVIDQLAVTPPAAESLARVAPAQVVVITAKRLPQS